MNKSILIIDTPNSCADCSLKRGLFCGENGNSLYEYIHYDESLNDKPSWCPLKPLPEKKEVEVNKIEDIMHTEYSIEDIYKNKYIADIRLATDKLISLGWNACLKEIEK